MKKSTLLILALGATLSIVPNFSFAYGPQHHEDQANHGAPSYRFRTEDGGHQHVDVEHRWHYARGERLPGDWHAHIVALPTADIALLPPPPPGYVFGYYDGWAIVYDPSTGIVLDPVDVM